MTISGSFKNLIRSGRMAPSPGERFGDLSTQGEPIFDEALLARLRRIVLLSRRAVSHGIAGEHKSRRRGSSPEFSDFKSYSQGDDYRRIDWNIYSRLDELFIRLSEVTTELTVHILLDSSASMHWSSSPEVPTKFTYARRLAGSLAYVSLWHFDRIAITPFRDNLDSSFGPVQGRSYIQPGLRFLASLRAHGATDVPDAIRRYTSARRQAGMLLVISDLLSGSADDLQDSLRHARTRGWQVTLIHIVDEAELSPESTVLRDSSERPVTVELIDVEGHDRLRLAETDDVLDRYRQAVGLWQDDLQRVTSAELVDLVQLRTNWPFESVVLSQLHQAGLVA
ncbi:DUF58 domain-containing protein [soil metagenome]